MSGTPEDIRARQKIFASMARLDKACRTNPTVFPNYTGEPYTRFKEFVRANRLDQVSERKS